MKFNPKKIKEIRKEKGITQEELAEQMGWKSRSAVAKRELGYIDVGANELHKIAEILEVKDLTIFFEK